MEYRDSSNLAENFKIFVDPANILLFLLTISEIVPNKSVHVMKKIIWLMDWR